MKKTLLTTTALVAGFVGAASAVETEMYGQVNKMILGVDDGQNTDISIADNDRSSTRIGVKGSQVLDNGLTASVLFEVEMQSNASDDLTQNQAGVGTGNQSTTPLEPAADLDFVERHARVGLAGEWGAVFVGQQSTATDSVTEQDLAGVSDMMGSDLKDIGGGFFFRNTAGALTTRTVDALDNNMDGNGRQDAIRYDSPIFNGFQARVSTAQGGDMDMGVFYSGKHDAFEVKGALGYVAFNDGATAATNVLESQMSGSVSVKHDSGVAGTVAMGQREVKNKAAGVEDPEFYYVKVGYAWDAFEVAADYGNHESQIAGLATDHEMDAMGLGAQYNMGNGVSLSAMYRQFDLDLTGTNTEEMNIFGVGMRVKF